MELLNLEKNLVKLKFLREITIQDTTYRLYCIITNKYLVEL